MTSPAPGQVPTPEPTPGAPVPPVATPPVDPATPPATPAPVDPAKPETFTREYVESLRRENADVRVKYKTAQDELDTLKRASMTKEQQVELDLKNRDEVVIPSLKRENQKLSVQVTASKLGIVDPEAASLLLDWSAIDAGKNVELALTELLVVRPWLKAQGPTATPAAPPAVTAPPSQSSPATPPASNAPPRFSKSQVDAMSDAERERRLPEILQAMREKRFDHDK